MSTGAFTWQFNEVGTFHYWTGYVEASQTASLRGTVTVKDPVDKLLEINVKVKNFEAQKCSDCNIKQQETAEKTCQNSNLNSCQSSDIDRYKMTFSTCSAVPRITSISPLSVSYNTVVEIQGDGFSSSQCENHVYIGDKECAIETSFPTKITCRLGKLSNLFSSKVYDLEVFVDNIGMAIHSQSGKIRFQPVVISILPERGSVAGGSNKKHFSLYSISYFLS